MSDYPVPTLESILDAAHSEFLEKGYRGAALRSISARAGVTTGAFYGYFRTKASLFDTLVGPCYHEMLKLYKAHLDCFFRLSVREQASEMNSYTERGLMLLSEYMYDHEDAFRLILCCSEGTRYNNLPREMARLHVNATRNFLNSAAASGWALNPVPADLEHMLTSGMFSAFFELIVHKIPREQSTLFVQELLTFYSAGWGKLMGIRASS